MMKQAKACRFGKAKTERKKRKKRRRVNSKKERKERGKVAQGVSSCGGGAVGRSKGPRAISSWPSDALAWSDEQASRTRESAMADSAPKRPTTGRRGGGGSKNRRRPALRVEPRLDWKKQQWPATGSRRDDFGLATLAAAAAAVRSRCRSCSRKEIGIEGESLDVIPDGLPELAGQKMFGESVWVQ